MKKYAVISMDVEDWYHTYFPEDHVDRTVSLLDGLDVALDIMKQNGIRGSFFVVGEIADKIKDKLRQMDCEGHDIAVHNNQHLRPVAMPQDAFRIQLMEAKRIIERILGHEVVGYRAPSFAIDDEQLDIVRECGFQYDSSKLKPQKSSKYGVLNLRGYKEEYPCIFRKDGFTEFEVSTERLGNMNMLLGGGYIRILPWFFMKGMTRKYLDSGKPYVMYIHPIDLSPKPMPKVEGISFDRYLRTRIGRRHMVKRFKQVIKMLKENGYAFVTFKELLVMQPKE